MAGESVRDYSSWKTLEASGASIANNAFGEANDATWEQVADGGGRPHLQVEIVWTYGANPSAGGSLGIYSRALQINTTNDAAAPSASYLRRMIGNEPVNTAGTAHAQRFDVMNAPTQFSAWLYNNASGQSISSGWTLRVRAFGFKAA